MWYFLSKHHWAVSFFMIIIMVGSLEISFAPYVLKMIIDAAVLEPNNQFRLLQAMLFPAILYALLSIIHNVAMRSYDYVCLQLFPKLRTEINVALFNHISQHSISFFQQNFSGEIADKISNMAEGVEAIIKIFNQYILANLMIIIIATILLSTIHLLFAVILLIWVVVYVSNGFWLAQKTAKFSVSFSEENNALSGRLIDCISNIVSAKILANVAYESSHIQSAVSEVGQKEIQLRKQIMKTHFYQNVIYTLLIISLLAALIYGRLNGFVSIGDFAFVLGLAITIATMVNGLTQSFPTLTREIGKCQQIINLLVIPHEIEASKNTQALVVTEGEIKFKHVNFGYNKTKFFDNLSVIIPPKQKVGIVGFSGAGKTTFINLILRLYDIQSGKISIDRQNIGMVTLDSLQKNIALIPQHPELFHRSIMENIRYGNIEASDDEVVVAAQLANCHEFINELNEGYNTIVGERGTKLSGGQCQRIAIARAILKKSPILILDEATSELDSVTEKKIQIGLREAMKDKTTIVVAHRLSTIMAMDRILFFKEGVMVEDGPVDELRAIKEGYFSIFLETQGYSK